MKPQNKTYCFNYSVEGIMTVLPLFIKSSGDSKKQAMERAFAYLSQKNEGRNITVFSKDYSDTCNTKNSVPEDFDLTENKSEFVGAIIAGSVSLTSAIVTAVSKRPEIKKELNARCGSKINLRDKKKKEYEQCKTDFFAEKLKEKEFQVIVEQEKAKIAEQENLKEQNIVEQKSDNTKLIIGITIASVVLILGVAVSVKALSK